MPGLVPSEGSLVRDAGFVGQGAVHGDGALGFGEEDGFLGGVGEEDDEEEGDECRYGAEDEEEELPASYGVGFDVADAVGHDTADDRGDAISEEPGRLPDLLLVCIPMIHALVMDEAYRAGCSSRL